MKKEEHTFSDIQEFVRYVLHDEQCQNPLLIHFYDVIPYDVIPSQSKKMIAANFLAEKVHTLARYTMGLAQFVIQMC